MSIVEIGMFKKHARIDFDDEDDYLQELLDNAEESVILQTGRSQYELEGMGGGYFPKSLKQAMIMLAAHWYNQREAVSGVQMSEVPYSLQALIKPFTRLTRDESRTDADQA